jgi:hypothetical protein
LHGLGDLKTALYGMLEDLIVLLICLQVELSQDTGLIAVVLTGRKDKNASCKLDQCCVAFSRLWLWRARQKLGILSLSSAKHNWDTGIVVVRRKKAFN